MRVYIYIYTQYVYVSPTQIKAKYFGFPGRQMKLIKARRVGEKLRCFY